MGDLFTFAAAERFPLEQGVPISRDKSPNEVPKWEKPDFPFRRMRVGDSFVVRPSDCGGAPLIVVQNLCSGAACQYRKKQPFGTWNFTTRQVGGRFVRVWRIL